MRELFSIFHCREGEPSRAIVFREIEKRHLLSLDINECEITPRICAEDMDCENTVGSYKCVNKAHSHKVTKVLREEDYDGEDENDDDDDDDEGNDDNDDYDEEITENPQSAKCEDGFERNENLECIGEC